MSIRSIIKRIRKTAGELGEDPIKEITALQKRVGAKNIEEVLQKALAVLEVCVEVYEEGGKIVAHYKDGKQSPISRDLFIKSPKA